MWRLAVPLTYLATDRWVRNSAPAYATVTYAANSPIEDRVSAETFREGVLASVFDGHGGWQISNYLHQHVSPVFSSSYQHSSGSPKERVKVALRQSYDQMETSIVGMARQAYKVGYGEVASTGSCAITAVVLPGFFAVANSGDCQAVVVSVKDGVVTGKNVCTIHSSNSPSEQEQLRAQHPGEPDIVVCRHAKACYVKQRLMPTRSFGDLDLKLAEFNNPDRLPRQQGFRSVKSPFTGPYITHIPDIVVSDISPHDKFLILASDGLWDEMSEQQAADLVGGLEDPAKAASVLLETALSIAAKNARLTVEDLKALKQGRRHLHDDISIAVVRLRKD